MSARFEKLMTEVMQRADRFGHREHVELTWLAVRRLGTSAAVEVVSDGILAAGDTGRPQKYNSTVSRAWVELVAHHVDELPEADFDTYIDHNPAPLDMRLLTRFYSSRVLASPAARRGWVEPDVTPFPVSNADATNVGVTALSASPAWVMTGRKSGHLVAKLTGHPPSPGQPGDEAVACSPPPPWPRRCPSSSASTSRVDPGCTRCGERSRRRPVPAPPCRRARGNSDTDRSLDRWDDAVPSNKGERRVTMTEGGGRVSIPHIANRSGLMLEWVTARYEASDVAPGQTGVSARC